jgi:hypothetical protein
MFTMLTVIRKRPEISTEEFRRFMEFDYGPVYAGLPQTREYVQYYVSDVHADQMRQAYMRETSTGIHSAVVDREVVPAPGDNPSRA